MTDETESGDSRSRPDREEYGDRQPEGYDNHLPGRSRLRKALRPRATRTQVLIGILFVSLGFGMAVQVRAHQGEDTFETARLDELVGVLDSLSERSERLRAELRDLRQTKRQVESGSLERQALVQAARDRADTLGLLAGTLPAVGEGIVLTIADPGGNVDAAMLLETLQELRDAGAEVVQIGDVRVVASTHFVDPPDGQGVVVDGRTLRPPYRFLAIGDASTMSTALGMPGGVLESLRGMGAEGGVVEKDRVEITALREPPEGEYARPADGENEGP